MTRLLRLLRDAPGAVEADLVAIYGPALPEDWRAARFPSLRRLCVLVSNLGDDSAVRRHERGGRPVWTPEAQVLDDHRRAWLRAHTSKDEPYPLPHPMSPLRKTDAELEAERRQRERDIDRHRLREAERQELIARQAAEEVTPDA